MNRMVERVKQEVRVQQALETGNGLLSSALQYKIASVSQRDTSVNPPEAKDHLTDRGYQPNPSREAASKPAPPAPIKPGTDKLLARIEKLMGKVPGGATTVGAAGGATVGGGAGALIGGAFDEKGSRRKAIVGMLAGMLAGGAAGGYAGHKYQA